MFRVVFAALSFSRSARIACLALGACSNANQDVQGGAGSSFGVIVVAHREGRQPLAGVKILDGKRVLGATEASGRVRLLLKGAEGDTLSLAIQCPESFASPEKPIVVGLRQMAAGSPAPTFETECIPLLHTIVVGLRAEHGAKLPIFRLNQVIGETDAAGVAHVTLRVTANEQITLTLDTSGNPNMKPQNPNLTFVAGDRDELVLLEQKFTVLKPVVRQRPKTIPQPL